MNRAFTLAEILIIVTILGVIGSILIPIHNHSMPDQDKITYKKALYSINKGIEEATDEKTKTSEYWKDPLIQANDFCESIASALNTAGKNNCNCEEEGAYTSSYEKPNFITTDGIRFWKLECKVFDDNHLSREILIDRNVKDKEKAAVLKERNREELGLKINIRYDGKIYTESEYEHSLNKNSFKMQK